jgi:hypothetical protein
MPTVAGMRTEQLLAVQARKKNGFGHGPLSCPLRHRLKTPNNTKKNAPKNTKREQENKSLSVNGDEEDGPKKTGDFYTATFRPFFRRPWHPSAIVRSGKEVDRLD